MYFSLFSGLHPDFFNRLSYVSPVHLRVCFCTSSSVPVFFSVFSVSALAALLVSTSVRYLCLCFCLSLLCRSQYLPLSCGFVFVRVVFFFFACLFVSKFSFAFVLIFVCLFCLWLLLSLSFVCFSAMVPFRFLPFV